MGRKQPPEKGGQIFQILAFLSLEHRVEVPCWHWHYVFPPDVGFWQNDMNRISFYLLTHMCDGQKSLYWGWSSHL